MMFETLTSSPRGQSESIGVSVVVRALDLTSFFQEESRSVFGLKLKPHSTIALTSPPWIRPVTQRIDYLLALPENWDGEGAKALDFECALEIIGYLLATAKHETPEPQLIPTSNSGVQIEWHLGGIDLELKFEPDASATYFHVGPDGAEKEGELAKDEFLVASLIRGLPARNEQPHTNR